MRLPGAPVTASDIVSDIVSDMSLGMSLKLTLSLHKTPNGEKKANQWSALSLISARRHLVRFPPTCRCWCRPDCCSSALDFSPHLFPIRKLIFWRRQLYTNPLWNLPADAPLKDTAFLASAAITPCQAPPDVIDMAPAAVALQAIPSMPIRKRLGSKAGAAGSSG